MWMTKGELKVDFIDVEIMRRLLGYSYPVSLDVFYRAFDASEADLRHGLDDAVHRLTERALVKVDHGTLWLTLAGRMAARYLAPTPHDVPDTMAHFKVS